jgi:hypothetical protein
MISRGIALSTDVVIREGGGFFCTLCYAYAMPMPMPMVCFASALMTDAWIDGIDVIFFYGTPNTALRNPE